ncbi:kinase-like domain-containing protein [Glomus cerebriforme]|uniref:Kinase-like domain-containing protein n=1 Tax=Glomus cerebriforme TaxID=658196 RepID=A0A397TW66_9GLOM|nr:kinase-like domain-containing protein [Glomus cerebriforme]
MKYGNFPIQSKTYYEKDISNQEFGFCSNCNKSQTEENWCKNCNSKMFQKDFKRWCKNEDINNFIQEAQLNARNSNEVIEWICYERLRNIQFIAQGGFSTIYKAIWLDGNIDCWDNEKKEWKRINQKLNENDYDNANKNSPLKENEKYGIYVVLKSLNDSTNIHEDFLMELKNHLQFLCSAINNYSNFIKIYGITQDPETLNYMIVLKEMPMGNLRSNLMIKKYNPEDKYYNLYEIASSLAALHKCDLVHGDLHSGNILFENVFTACISDFGLSRPANQSINTNKIISGVLPYIAPEVLRGHPYTKAADIYSFGIIMWEFTSGVPAFHNIPHDFHLCLDICKGVRPEIIEGTDSGYIELMKKCWNTDQSKRPKADELAEMFDVLSTKHIINHEKRMQVPAVPGIIQEESEN